MLPPGCEWERCDGRVTSHLQENFTGIHDLSDVFQRQCVFFPLEALDERIFSLPRAAAGQIERDSSSKPTEQSTVWREVQDSVQKNK